MVQSGNVTLAEKELQWKPLALPSSALEVDTTALFCASDNPLDHTEGDVGRFFQLGRGGTAFPQMSFDHWDFVNSDPMEEGTKAHADYLTLTRKRKSLKDVLPTVSDYTDRECCPLCTPSAMVRSSECFAVEHRPIVGMVTVKTRCALSQHAQPHSLPRSLTAPARSPAVCPGER